MGVVNVFNSPAGRAVISSNSTSSSRPQYCQNRRTHSDVTKFVLSPENLIAGDLQTRNINNTQNMFLSKSEGRISEYKKTDTKIVNNCDFFRDGNTVSNSSSQTANFAQSAAVKGDDFRDSESNAQLTRRLINRNNVESNQVNNNSNTLAPPLDRSHSLNAEENSHETKPNNKTQQDGADLVMYKTSKITKYSSEKDVMKRHYNRRFSDEKCDILRRLLSGFLSGWTAGTGAEIARWRKRKSSEELYREASLALGIPCELTDSCRCLECQCHYFDCGDTESDTSDVSINLFDCEPDDWQRVDTSILPDTSVINEIESKILKIPDSLIQNNTLSECLDQEMRLQADEDDLAGDCITMQQDGDDEEAEICNNEMAAGTPVILDHLLNNPMTCVLQ